jgi:hypothetical protein
MGLRQRVEPRMPHWLPPAKPGEPMVLGGDNPDLGAIQTSCRRYPA